MFAIGGGFRSNSRSNVLRHLDPWQRDQFSATSCQILADSVNFSIVGRGADLAQRKQYVDYDLAAGERESLVARLTAKFPEIDFDIAGESGIDIYPMRKNKRQILQYFDSRPIVFFADKMQPKGNDFALACAKNLTH